MQFSCILRFVTGLSNPAAPLRQGQTRRLHHAALSATQIRERSRAADARAACGAASRSDEPDEDFHSRRGRGDCGERIGPRAVHSAAALSRQSAILSEQSRGLESIPGAIAATADGAAASDGAAGVAGLRRGMDGGHNGAFVPVVQSASAHQWHRPRPCLRGGDLVHFATRQFRQLFDRVMVGNRLAAERVRAAISRLSGAARWPRHHSGW